jgi:hypothetical protein
MRTKPRDRTTGVSYRAVKRISWALMASGGNFKDEDMVFAHSHTHTHNNNNNNNNNNNMGT